MWCLTNCWQDVCIFLQINKVLVLMKTMIDKGKNSTERKSSFLLGNKLTHHKGPGK